MGGRGLRIERMCALRKLIAEGKHPNCRTMAEKLEVSPKTVQRDLDFMRDRMGLPIAYDQAKFGFAFTAPVTEFPRRGDFRGGGGGALHRAKGAAGAWGDGF